jgi:hypothetical protein
MHASFVLAHCLCACMLLFHFAAALLQCLLFLTATADDVAATTANCLLLLLLLLATTVCYPLFIATANDPNNFAQRMDSWMGKILRIRLSTAPGATGYTIPGDNMSGEIWAYGFRYVYRYTVTVCT